jgi:hypothetical protein
MSSEERATAVDGATERSRQEILEEAMELRARIDELRTEDVPEQAADQLQEAGYLVSNAIDISQSEWW